MKGFVGAILALCIWVPSVWASSPNVCDIAALQASKLTGVPLQVLMAITRVETGRTRNGDFQPWPWTANVAGQGHWFKDPTTARFFLRAQLAEGKRSFDVGCFQLNYHWHGKAFQSLEHMLDPSANALYAAQFLRDLQVEFGSWERAVGAYHSRTQIYAEKYVRRFRQIHATLLLLPPKLEAQARISTKSVSASLHVTAPSQAVSSRGSLWKN